MRWQRSGSMPRCRVMPLASWLSESLLRGHWALPCRHDQLPGYWKRCAATGLLGYGFLMRAFFEVFAPAADGHVVAAGHNSRLLPAAFPCRWVLLAPLVVRCAHFHCTRSAALAS
jgi:hypothetical protein